MCYSEVLQYIKCDGKNEILTKIYHKVQYLLFPQHFMLCCIVRLSRKFQILWESACTTSTVCTVMWQTFRGIFSELQYIFNDYQFCICVITTFSNNVARTPGACIDPHHSIYCTVHIYYCIQLFNIQYCTMYMPERIVILKLKFNRSRNTKRLILNGLSSVFVLQTSIHEYLNKIQIRNVLFHTYFSKQFNIS